MVSVNKKRLYFLRPWFLHSELKTKHCEYIKIGILRQSWNTEILLICKNQYFERGLSCNTEILFSLWHLTFTKSIKMVIYYFRLFNILYMFVFLIMFSTYYTILHKQIENSLIYYLDPDILPDLFKVKKMSHNRFSVQREAVKDFCSTHQKQDIMRAIK